MGGKPTRTISDEELAKLVAALPDEDRQRLATVLAPTSALEEILVVTRAVETTTRTVETTTVSRGRVPGPSTGWYPDPICPGRSRWWNSAGWSDTVSDGSSYRTAPFPTAIVHKRHRGQIARCGTVCPELTAAPVTCPDCLR